MYIYIIETIIYCLSAIKRGNLVICNYPYD